MGENIKLTLENFGTIKLAHVSDGQAILLGTDLFVKVNRATKGETNSIVEIDTGKLKTVSQHLLCIEVELEVVVRIKQKSVPQKLYSNPLVSEL